MDERKVRQRFGQGKEKARNFLIENPEIAEEIKDGVMIAGGFARDSVGQEVTEDSEAENVPNS